ncbi:hypothetical protein [Burkholderia pseudomallei]|uniref:hypothetical protein n=1 Tax=Burkholderia pseudomallei TaxID=28450 RepID=UPI0011C4C043|nr:hypothetical protein [Burkholderia pseudomallei]
MINFTSLEKLVIEKMLNENFGLSLGKAGQSLEIEKREFSLDVSDSDCCVGFYVHFKNNDFLGGVGGIPHHISLHADHDWLPAGGDFILFLKPDGCVDFLEATFYGFSMPISDLVAESHHFNLKMV